MGWPRSRSQTAGACARDRHACKYGRIDVWGARLGLAQPGERQEEGILDLFGKVSLWNCFSQHVERCICI